MVLAYNRYMKSKDLSVSDVCEELGLHENTVRRLINQGVIPAYRAGLRAFRVTREALDGFKQSGGPNPVGRPRKEWKGE